MGGYAWSEKEIEILRNYYGQIKINELQKMLNNRKIPSIHAKVIKLNKNGYHIKGDSSLAHKIYQHNEVYFSIPNTYNSYWAGFLAADGYFTRKVVAIGINAKDETILKEFIKDTEYTGKIYHYKKQQRSGYVSDMCNISITSHRWIEDLIKNYNLEYKKSLTLKPPDLTLELAVPFIIGYIDGDGAIFNKKNKQGKEYLTLDIGGTTQIIEWIVQIFQSICPNIQSNKIQYSKKVTNFATYRVSGNKAKEILNKMLEYYDGFKLNRKWGIL